MNRIQAISYRSARRALFGTLAVFVGFGLSGCSNGAHETSVPLPEGAPAVSEEATSMQDAARRGTVDKLLTASVESYNAGRYEECMRASSRAAKLDPGSAPALNNIGICAGRLGRWDEAIGHLEEALRIDPGMERAANNLAWVRQQKAAE